MCIYVYTKRGSYNVYLYTVNTSDHLLRHLRTPSPTSGFFLRHVSSLAAIPADMYIHKYIYSYTL